MVHHDHAVAITIQRNTQIGFFCNHARLQRTNVGRTHFFIDVDAIRLTANRNDICAQFTEYIWRNVIRRAVRTIHHDF
ncbi:hypothetical protein D3C81_1600900 [compost metagenome]